MPHIKRFAVVTTTLLLTLAAVTPLRAATQGQDGGIDLVVSFEVDDTLEASIEAPLDDPLAASHYCSTFQELSSNLYQATEGAHWVRRVRFFEDTAVRDIRWHYLADVNSATSYGSRDNYILLRERGTAGPDPYAMPENTPEGLGRLLSHEFGHYFYWLPDEYIDFKHYAAVGFCDDGSYQVLDNGDGTFLGVGTTCDEEAFQCGGNACILDRQCMQGANGVGTFCVADVEAANPDSPSCGDGGICLGMGESRAEAAQKQRICLNDTELSPADDSQGVCAMASSSRRRWCDGGLDADGHQLAGATHTYTADGKLDYGVDVEFDLGLLPGEPDGAENSTDWVGWNCWDRAADRHIDLRGVHTIGSYPSLTEIEADHGKVPAVECQWLIDGLSGDGHPLLLLDRSGSMAYFDTLGVRAIDLARDGALYFYNAVDDGNFVGVKNFNFFTETSKSAGLPLAYGPKAGDIEVVDELEAIGSTDIGVAIDDAVAEILGTPGVPWADRWIVLLSDGKDNAGQDPFAAAAAACEAGIAVKVLAYGDADSASLDQLDACGEPPWIVGTEDIAVQGVDYGEPDPLEIKTAIARAGLYTGGAQEVEEHRAPLEPLAQSIVEEITFDVPEDTAELTFSWMGNRTCSEIDPPDGCEPLFNELARFELVEPDGTVRVAPAASRAETNGVYRKMVVRGPAAGRWTARIDKTEPPGLPPGDWETQIPETKLSWIAWIDHPSFEARAWAPVPRGPLDYPMPINAQLLWGTPTSEIEVEATVTHRGNSWTVEMFDDGLHADGDAGDGTYGGVFNPDGSWPNAEPGAYRVKVELRAVEGEAIGIVAGDSLEDPDPIAAPRPATVELEAETHFRLSGKYTATDDGDANPGRIEMDCPDLVRGVSTEVNADVFGFAGDETTIKVRLEDPVGIDSLVIGSPNAPETADDPILDLDIVFGPDDICLPGWYPLLVQRGQEIIESSSRCRVCVSARCDEIELASDDWVQGRTVELAAYGAEPGETALFVASPNGVGIGPCPPPLGGVCLDLALPVKLLGSAVADEFGKASLPFVVPGVPGGTRVTLQAAIARGADSVVSNTVEKRVIEP